MEKAVTLDFFEFAYPYFNGVSENWFNGVKQSYGNDVLSAVTTVAMEHSEDVVKLANLFLPELRVVLARQRRDYGISDDYPAQFPVEEQARNVDDTPVHNLGMERQCATVDQRLKKLQTVCRSAVNVSPKNKKVM